MKSIVLLFIFVCTSFVVQAQNAWSIMFAPTFTNRVDDLFMVNVDTGYAVSGDGKIVKTVNQGSTWTLLNQSNTVYCRSVEFVNTQVGFVGGFQNNLQAGPNVLRKTSDGGATWTDLTLLLAPPARMGICGLAAADANTIYGCGNWYQDSAYIVKTTDAGSSWTFIDMSMYASSLIDMYFSSPDTGFVTGKGPLPLETAVILYTTDGGQTWTYKFQNTIASEYCWKIQHLTDQLFYASIEDMTATSPQILKSIDGGMNWTIHQVRTAPYNIEGIGFIDSLHGFTGGDWVYSFESTDGGLTWDSVPYCPSMNRVFRVNDSILFATGMEIWRYAPLGTGIVPTHQPITHYTSINCHPNPVNDILTIDIKLTKPTQALLLLTDAKGNQLQTIDNSLKQVGDYRYTISTQHLAAGTYFIVLKTHEDKVISKVLVVH